ncbi:hypothetical protein DFJ58DRAFT_833519 [Suillus subalutaceus]|uniref:uncharacterized protein n=1 Tax=Suillus subalutaceus TaxID=48586 RepID=UPI001B872549|nr:uncharacterized protein DFJ58DRAFT_833519 [Suillus subalutaceus]KAG1817414.1 hypothetical protein DFJ58DRAFT_833519 [Suillus subalutaceus]
MSSENEPLIPSAEHETVHQKSRTLRNRALVWSALVVIIIVVAVVALVNPSFVSDIGLPEKLPRDPKLAAQHLPIVARFGWRNNVTDIHLDSQMPMHVDIPRLREGKVGGFFWSVYMRAPDFLKASWRVRDTLEQIDVAKGLISKIFAYAVSASGIKSAIRDHKIASILGVEGSSQCPINLGNSIAVLRQYYELGVRYVTLTHSCHNAFADSCGMLIPSVPRHYGLSPLGFKLVEEMNRLGMLPLLHSKAPVIWSHSSARAIHDVARNVPDEVLSLVGFGDGQRDAVNFNGPFVAADGEADLETVADHMAYCKSCWSENTSGSGSDYDGIQILQKTRGCFLNILLFKQELAGLTGGNFLRVAKELQAAGTLAKYDIYDKREDLPIRREL